MRAFTAGQWDEWFFRFVIWDHFFHKSIHLNYWSEILRPPLSALGRLMRLICRKTCCASPRAKVFTAT
jgi:hypothetical protein